MGIQYYELARSLVVCARSICITTTRDVDSAGPRNGNLNETWHINEHIVGVVAFLWFRERIRKCEAFLRPVVASSEGRKRSKRRGGTKAKKIKKNVHKNNTRNTQDTLWIIHVWWRVQMSRRFPGVIVMWGHSVWCTSRFIV